jgi:hypothetical protein
VGTFLELGEAGLANPTFVPVIYKTRKYRLVMMMIIIIVIIRSYVVGKACQILIIPSD